MNHVSATIGTRAVDPRTGDDNPVLKQMVRFRSNLQEQLSVMDAKLDSLLDMATNIQLLISKMNKERGLVENVVAAYPQITTRFGEKNQLPVPSSVPIATTVSDSVTSSDSVELMNKDTIQPEEKFEAKSETQQKSEIESGASPIVPEGAGRIVTVLSKETGNSDFELESSKNNVDKFVFGSELRKNNNAQEVFDGLTNWDLKPPEEVAAFVDSKKDIYAHMKTDLYRASVATSVEDFEKKCNEAMQVFDPRGSALDVRVLKVGGPSWSVRLGRRDSTTPSRSVANTDLPSPFAGLDTLISAFSNKGLSAKDMVALSEAHPLGQAQCFLFRGRIYSNGTDIDAGFTSTRRRQCPQSGGDGNLAALDLVTPNSFDNNYFRNLVQRKGLLQSDQVLLNGSTASLVTDYSKNPRLFAADFANAMIKMSEIEPLLGQNGIIRRVCSAIN